MELMLTSAFAGQKTSRNTAGYFWSLLRMLILLGVVVPVVPNFSWKSLAVVSDVLERAAQVGNTRSLPTSDEFFISPFEHFYDFSSVPRAFHHRTSLHYLSQFPKKMLFENVQQVLPANIRKRAKSFLPYFFYFAERYNIDPYWAISIAWTESHFNFKARSYIGAQGIMQIMPATKDYLLRLLRYHPSHQGNKTLTNIHLGIYYLSRLLRQFHGNYVEATVAYNMGPGWVKRWKRKRRRVGSRNNVYLRKVKRYYRKLSLAHYKLVQQCKYDYLRTYVVRREVSRSIEMSMEDFFVQISPLIVQN